MNNLKITLLVLIIFYSHTSYADKSMKIGHKGNSNQVDRTISVIMHDHYFEPSYIEINNNETIRFEVTNLGSSVHEFNIANKALHLEHQAEMEMLVENEIINYDTIDHDKMDKMAKKDHSMGHSHSNSVLLAPNESKSLIWDFKNSENIEIACNVPGHYDIGMISTGNLK